MLLMNLRRGLFHVVPLVFAALLGLGAAATARADPRIELLEAVKADDGSAVAALLRRGVSPNTRERDYGTAPVMAAQLRSYAALRALAASPRVDLQAANPKDETALMLVAHAGELELVRLLVERGAEPNRPGWTALHYAASAGHTRIVRYLIEQNAYIDAQSPNRTTPLMMAARHKQIDAMRLLLELGADPSAINDAGLRATDYLEHAGEPEQAKWLRERADEYVRRYGTLEKPVPAGGASTQAKPAN